MGNRITGIHEHRDTKTLRYRDTEIKVYKGSITGTQLRTGIQKHSETGPDTGIQRYRGPKIRGYSYRERNKNVLYLPKNIYKGIYLKPSPKQHRRLKVPQDIPLA